VQLNGILPAISGVLQSNLRLIACQHREWREYAKGRYQWAHK
jgi:hypothetical protein